MKWVRSLVMALPVDAHHLRDDDGRKRVAHQFANQTAAIWKNIEQNSAAGELDLMETWEAIKQPADQWGSSARCRSSKPERRGITGSWA